MRCYGAVPTPDDAEVPLIHECDADAPSNRSENPPASSKPSLRHLGAVLGLLAAVLGAIILTMRRQISMHTRMHAHTSSKEILPAVLERSALRTNAHRKSASTDSSSGMKLVFSVKNKYGSHTGMQTEYPWLQGKKLIEPNRATTLAIQDADDDVQYSWELTDSTGSTVQQWQGSSVVVTVASTGKYSITLRGVSSDGSTAGSAGETVYVLYVKRELRSLDDEDRLAVLDAMSYIWNTTTEEGQEKFGPSFYNIEHFAAYHLNMAAQKECDHMHLGLGFFTQHVALTFKFEQTLRQVNSGVTLPYWDYTIDFDDISLNRDGNYSQYWLDIEPLSDKWFGKTDTQQKTVTTGRWAYIKVPKSKSTTRNAYGLMRSPWNCNKNEYLTRHSSFCGMDWSTDYEVMPSCTNHYNAVAGDATWQEFGMFVQVDPHGPIHGIMGGVMNCDSSFAKMKDLGLTESWVASFATGSFGRLRAWYRYGILSCPTNCTQDTPQEDCLCTCSSEELLKDYDIDKLLYLFTEKSDITVEDLYQLSDENKIKFVDLLCSSGLMVGDPIEAASALDPSFYPIHPAVLRLWEAKKLWNLWTDESWADGSSAYDGCGGHNSGDYIPLKGLFADKADAYMTNAEFYDKLDPTSDDRTFIFDDFTWTHCLDTQGIDFSNITLGQTIDP